MSALGPKRTSLVASHMSAFGGKADMAFCGISLSWSLLGVKRTCCFALRMSAFDRKRTWDHRPTRFVSLTAQQFPRPATFPGSESSPHMIRHKIRSQTQPLHLRWAPCRDRIGYLRVRRTRLGGNHLQLN